MMSNVPKDMKEEAAKRGIIPGSRIRCAEDGSLGTVSPYERWTYHEPRLIVGSDDLRCPLYARGSAKGQIIWATVITPAPAKEEEGLNEGDACECDPAMRAAIVELAKQLGVGVRGGTTVNYPTLVFMNHSKGELQGDGPRNDSHKYRRYRTPEDFIAKMLVTAKKPKPEPPIMIKTGSRGDEYPAEFRVGSVKIGCTSIDNDTVRAIASKLID